MSTTTSDERWTRFFMWTIGVLFAATIAAALVRGLGRGDSGEGATAAGEARPAASVAAATAPPGIATGARATLDLGETLGGADTVGYARALEPRPFVFPADHGAHPDFRTEWWYVTNNLETASGRRFGVHFTIFRSALAPPATVSDTLGEWATPQVYMGHFAVADVEAERFREAERFTRPAAGLAGATSEPVRIWMDDWSLAQTGSGTWPLRLRASEDGVAVDLTLDPQKPHVLQGDRGLSQKGDEPGNASFYYSYTRLRTVGTVTVDGESHAVTGSSWMDREWSTSALDSTQAGWDWFALQLTDGRDVMVYRLRGRDGSTDPLSKGVVVDAAGVKTDLQAPDFELEVVERWSSPIDGAVYPSTWRVRVPEEGIDLRVVPVLRDQEMDVTVRYWEGAVDLYEGASDRLVGRGYVELTGYAGPEPGGS